jgi:hypothetical protein
MEPFWYIFIGIAVLVVGLIALNAWQQKKRTEAWQRVAGELHIEFLGNNNDVLNRCGGMKLFSRGRSRRFLNAICGDAGDTKIILGDYRFRTGSGKNSSTHVYTVCVLQSAQLNVTGCYLRPQISFFDAIGAMLGGQDINFADDETFSRAYVLQGEDEEAIRKLFDTEVRAWFVERSQRHLQFEARGGTLVFHTGRRRKPDEAKQLMGEALDIMNLLAKQHDEA